MEDVGGVDVLEAAEDLVEEVADVVRGQFLGAQQLMQVCLHQTLRTQHCLASVSFLFCFTLEYKIRHVSSDCRDR